MNLANGRSGHQLSEKAVEILLRDRSADSKVSDTLSGAIIAMPVGEATQDAAIAAIAELGGKHEILRTMAIQALQSLSSFKPLARQYLAELRGH